jgi:hypothetical protein
VHDYGDVCQAITELAVELDATVSAADFHTLNRCLDNAIAAAVTAWTGDRGTDASGTSGQHGSRDERLRRLVSGSITAFELLRDGKVAAGGATGMVLRQNLQKMRACSRPRCPRWRPPAQATTSVGFPTRRAGLGRPSLIFGRHHAPCLRKANVGLWRSLRRVPARAID